MVVTDGVTQKILKYDLDGHLVASSAWRLARSDSQRSFS